MGWARLVKLVGIIALIVGVIGFFLPDQFLYSPYIEDLLTQYGNALFPGISSNPAVHTLIVKAPAVLLMIVGGFMALAGFLSEPERPTVVSGATRADKRRDVEDLIRKYGPDEKKYDYPGSWGQEPTDRKKP